MDRIRAARSIAKNRLLVLPDPPEGYVPLVLGAYNPGDGGDKLRADEVVEVFFDAYGCDGVLMNEMYDRDGIETRLTRAGFRMTRGAGVTGGRALGIITRPGGTLRPYAAPTGQLLMPASIDNGPGAGPRHIDKAILLEAFDHLPTGEPVELWVTHPVPSIYNDRRRWHHGQQMARAAAFLARRRATARAAARRTPRRARRPVPIQIGYTDGQEKATHPNFAPLRRLGLTSDQHELGMLHTHKMPNPGRGIDYVWAPHASRTDRALDRLGRRRRVRFAAHYAVRLSSDHAGVVVVLWVRVRTTLRKRVVARIRRARRRAQKK